MAKMWRTFFKKIYYFYFMHLIFVSVWFYSWTKHISCLCLPWLCTEKLLRMGTASWGGLSALTMARAAKSWRRGQSEHVPRAGDLQSMERRCIPGQPLCQEKSCDQAQDSFGTGLVRDLNIWFWAQHPWLAPDPAFQGDTQRIVTLCPLEMTFHPPARSSATERFHSWLRSQNCWPLLSSLVCNQ